LSHDPSSVASRCLTEGNVSGASDDVSNDAFDDVQESRAPSGRLVILRSWPPTPRASNDLRRAPVTLLRVSFDEILPIREAVRALPRALERLDRGEAAHFVITRRNEPRAVLVNVERYEQLLKAEAGESGTREAA
jgi:hypothetical protein